MKRPLIRNANPLSILLVIGCFIYASPDGHAQQKIAPGLFPIFVEGKGYGYIDRTGQIIIPPSFEEVGNFSEGLARVKVGGKWGFIDEAGVTVIEPTFDQVEDFSEGLAAVKVHSKARPHFQWGYIDRSGEFIIKPQYWHGGSFSYGLAVIANENRCGFIDQTGQVMIKPQYSSARKFSEGLAAIYVGDKVGYINTAGGVVIEPKFHGGSDFSEGLALVSLGKRQYGYIDKSGQVVIRLPEGAEGGNFSEGLAQFQAIAGVAGCGYIDQTGKIAIEPQFHHCGEFSEGLADVLVIDESDKLYYDIKEQHRSFLLRYIDRTGRVIINPPFTAGLTFRGGLATVWDGSCGVPGYIDHSGKVVWQPIFGESRFCHLRYLPPGSTESTEQPAP